MADNAYEFTGKTVDEAVAEGLAHLNVVRSDVAVEVLSKGSRGIFGIGSEPARVRITLETKEKPAQAEGTTRETSSSDSAGAATSSAEPSDVAEIEESESMVESTDADGSTDLDIDDEISGIVESSEAGALRQDEETADDDRRVAASDGAESRLTDDELAEVAAEMLAEIVRLMGFEAEVEAAWQEADEDGGAPFLRLDIEGEDLGALIGRRGETLASLQYLVRLMVNQRIKEWRNIVVDVEKYKERRETQLNQLALRMADQVADSGRAMAMEPMPPNERRIVHIALRDHPYVYTQSSGEDDHRKVNIVPKDTA